MQKNIIDAKDVRYIGEIPEFKNELPKGILNKKRADVGGTFAALNYPTHYIIAVPFKSQIDSMEEDKNVPYDIFVVQEGVKEIDFIIYLETHDVHKIAVTYDSSYKVSKWLSKNGYDTKGYKVLIDEFHITLEHYGFRGKAIDSMIKALKYFDHVTFMSATPFDDIFIPKFLKKEPYTVIKWKISEKPSIYSFDGFNTKNNLIAILKIFQSRNGLSLDDINNKSSKVEEVFIYINSVKYIASIIKTLKLDPNDVKVVCADNIRNTKTIEDTGIKISKVTSKNKKINFFTSTAFESCNLFSNNGLVIVVSDASYNNTLIDLGTTLVQITGRLRFNDQYQNIFRNTVFHIVSTGHDLWDHGFNMYNYLDSTIKKLNKNIVMSTDIVSSYDKLNTREKKTFRETHSENSFYAIYNEGKDQYEMSEMIIEYRDYISKKIKMYHNQKSVKNAYSDNFIFEGFYDSLTNNSNIEIELAINVNFKVLLMDYIKLRGSDPNHKNVGKYEKEYPIFKKSYDILGSKGIASCKYSKALIERRLHAYSDEIVNKVFGNIHKSMRVDVSKKRVNKSDKQMFITTKVLKDKIIEEYDKLDIDIKKIGFSVKKIINFSTLYSLERKQLRVNKKQTSGYIIKPDILKIYKAA